MSRVAPGQDKGFNYSRTNNPSRQRSSNRSAETELEWASRHASRLFSLTPGLAAEKCRLSKPLFASRRRNRAADRSLRRRHLSHSQQSFPTDWRRRPATPRFFQRLRSRCSHHFEDEARLDRIAHQPAPPRLRHRWPLAFWRIAAALLWSSTTHSPRPVFSSHFELGADIVVPQRHEISRRSL